MKCNFCNHSKGNKIFKTNLPSFRHLDFKKISTKSNFIQCKKCGLINVINNQNSKKNEKMFKSTLYSKSKQTNQKKYFKKKIFFRNEIQSDLISKELELKSNILDIGCFDGKLLYFLSKKLKKSSLTGFEINKKLKKNFPSGKRFKFINDFEKLPKKKYDAIILSHSIMYFKKLDKLFSKIINLLMENGKIFIQVPNIESNPLNVLMGDQRNIFTINSMKNICNLLGLKIKLIEKKIFKRELLFVITKKKYKRPYKLITNDNSLKNSINYLKNLKIKILKNLNQSDYYIFGTTVNAAFIYEFAKDKISFFIDENNDKEYFKKLNVYKPNEINLKFNTIVPSVFGKELKNKLQKKYNSKFILI